MLLVLAGVSISILTGENGVLKQAQESKGKTDKAKIEEMKQLTASRAAMNLEGYTYTDKKGVSVYIPTNFAVSENPDEQLVKDGLVVIDKYGDEFVWIPATSSNFQKKECVKSYNLGVSGADIRNLTDDYGVNFFIKSYNEERDNVITAGGFFVSRYEIGADGTEQRNLTGVEAISYYSKTGVTDDYVYTNLEKSLYWSQADDSQKNNIIENLLSKINSKQGIEPVRRMTQNECLCLANLWKSGKDYQSGLITGTQWDRMTSFICDDESNIDKFTIAETDINNVNFGNYKDILSTTYKSMFTSGSGDGTWKSNPKGRTGNVNEENERYIFPTGEFINNLGRDTKMKNVYDVAGNVWEWTTEESQYGGLVGGKFLNRVTRGGGAGNYIQGHPVTCRNGYFSGIDRAIWDIGFRVVIYVNASNN